MNTTLPFLGLDAKPAEFLPALCLWQPFAQLVIDGLKPVETRRSATTFRGRFVVCATKAPAPRKHYGPVMERLDRSIGRAASRYHRDNLRHGVVLGIVDLVNCRPMEEADEPKAWVSRFTDEGALRWAWVLSPHVVRLKPAPVHGHQFWFRVPTSLCVPEAA